MRTSLQILTFLILNVTGAFAQSCSGVAVSNVCCNGRITGNSESSNDLTGLICCEGDPDKILQISPAAPTTCTAGTAIPMTQFSASQFGGSASSTSSIGSTSSMSGASSTIIETTSTSTSLTTSTGVSTTSTGSVTVAATTVATSTETGGVFATQAPWAAAAIVAGGIAALV